MTAHEADQALAKIARRQHGVWNRQQALTAGLTPRMVRTRLERGQWLRLDAGVYASAGAPATWHRQVMAAVVAEPWAVAARRSAAVLHRVPGFRPGRPAIVVPPGANARGRLATVHRGVDIRSTVVDGIPCTTLAQTIVDLAPVTGDERLRGAVAAVADRSQSELSEVRDRFCELAPRGGRDLRRLQAVLSRFGAGDLPLESELEAVLRGLMDGRGLPAVSWQAPFPGRVPGGQRVDCLIEEWALVVEGDGRAWHTRVEDFERDRRRDAEAAAAGLLTLRFTWHQLTQNPAWVLEMIRAAGQHRRVA